MKPAAALAVALDTSSLTWDVGLLTWCLPVAVSKAFSTLSDGNKRAAYDRYGDTEGTVNGQRQHAAGPNFGGEGFDPEEIFNMFFNGGFGGGGGFGARYTLALCCLFCGILSALHVSAGCKCIASEPRPIKGGLN